MNAFTRGHYNLNLIALRLNRVGLADPGVFCDLLAAIWNTPAGWEAHYWPCTSVPTEYWLRHPQNPAGTAILAPGQYRGAYAVGTHRGRHAIVQVDTVKVWRDDNRDADLDIDGLYHYDGRGLNIHDLKGDEGRASMGCTVVQDSGHMDMIVDMARMSCDIYGPRLTYTVLVQPG